MIIPSRDATIALCGVMQPLYWVHEIAARGINHPERLAHSVNGILCTDPDEIMSVYAGLPGLRDGIHCLLQVLLGRGQLELTTLEQGLISRYAGQILRLGTQVRRHAGLAAQLAEGLNQVPAMAAADAPDDLLQLRVEKLAALYVARISPLKPRVMVSGQPDTLRNHEYVTAIRCHLLAAVRSAVLWHQCGGRFWHLVLMRGFWLRHARQLASELS